MIISLKNKHTLKIDDFYFKCCIGKNGLTKRKIEGDKKTPKGIFSLEHLYYRHDKISKLQTNLKTIKIKKNLVGAMMLIIKKNITNLFKFQKI